MDHKISGNGKIKCGFIYRELIMRRQTNSDTLEEQRAKYAEAIKSNTIEENSIIAPKMQNLDGMTYIRLNTKRLNPESLSFIYFSLIIYH